MKLRQSSIVTAASLSCNRPQGVKRWDGSGRRSVQWDGLRRDNELWLADGDCFVHLYERGYSRRGPSFCVPMEALKHAACGNLFTLCFAHTASRAQVPASQLSALKNAPEQMYELYIPAPEGCMREEAFQWHLTTRNFFAFLFKKPLVGTHLGGALVDLQERLHLFRSAQPMDNQSALMEYAEEVGYLNFTHRPDNALAMLYYAEHYEIKDLWIDAYAHCVGMNETLFLSSEHESIPRVTKALITRASLEMDLHLTRVSKAVSTFLEAELSPSNLGLPPGPRAHLDRFRSFLNSFYVDKFGYWPPPTGTGFSRDLCRSMYYDFKALYDYLVDTDSSESIQAQKPADGGICVLQNVQAFDRKHKYTPLPHPLPLLPTTPRPSGRVLSQRNLVALTLGNKQSKTDKQLMQLAALSNATNSRKTTVANAPLVRVYKIFERDSLDKQKEKVSISDARKARWILIYATLQMLVSVTRAPCEPSSLRRTSLPTKLTVKTSFSSPLGAFSPVTEPIVEDDEKRTPPLESVDELFDFNEGGIPLSTASPKESSSRRNSYFHTRHTSAESASTTASSELMRRSASSGSAHSSGPNSVAWSPAESSSTATSVTSRPSSPSPCNEDAATDDALARTEQLMAELDIEATQEHVLRRQDSIIRRSSTSRYVEHPPVRRSSSVYSSSIYSSYPADAEFGAEPISRVVSRPGTASSDYSKARRVMGLPEGVNLGDGGRMCERDVANMYQQLAGNLWAA
ncbi:hypothetical protein SLS54_004089 [Diplodia seriata]